MELDFRIQTLGQEHVDNVKDLTRIFGDEKRPHIIARYMHQLYLSEENPNLNGNLPRITYSKTLETLKAEYS